MPFRLNRIFLLLFIPPVLFCFTGCATFRISQPKPEPSPEITAWIAFWDWDRGMTSIRKNTDLISEIMPFWYDMDSTGRIFPSQGIPEMREQGLLNHMNEKKFTDYCHRHRIKVIPLISNEFNKYHIHEMLSNESVKQFHIDNIIQLVLDNQYDGINIDYEGIMKTDRDLYTSFLMELADRLHHHGKILSVAVHAKTSEPGQWELQIGHDYPSIGAIADRVEIMAYDHHWATGSPGCIQPIDWIDEILTFAVTVIPPEKIYLGLGIYGINWGEPKSLEAIYQDAKGWAKENQSVISFDTVSKENFFTYTDSTSYSNRTVWFQDRKTFQYRWDLVKKYHLGGIAFWRLGGEDPGIWRILRSEVYSSDKKSLTFSW